MRGALERRLLTFFEDRGQPVDLDTRLIEAEIVDSMSILELAMLIETELGVELDGDLLRAETFTSVRTLLDVLRARGLVA